MNEESNICYYTNRYNEQFRLIEHYQRYPQMMPFVGEGYEEYRTLLLLESHYLPDNSDFHCDAERWYNGRSHSLSEEEKRWIHTRNITNDRCHWDGGKSIGTINLALIEALGREREERDNMFQYFCYMNAFQRPAIKGRGIQETCLDIEKSDEVIRQVIETLKPRHALFSSKKAAGKFMESVAQQDVEVGATQHPSSPWWNKESGAEMITGKERFICFSDVTQPLAAVTPQRRVEWP